MSTIVRSVMTLALLLSVAACGSRVLVATGTTLGLKATPGDGQSRPPQVTLGYKRAEVALVPTDGAKATKHEDAYSVLAVFDFRSRWFGKTELSSFIGSGNAAREIQGQDARDEQFAAAFAAATITLVPQVIQARRIALIEQLESVSDAEAGELCADLDLPIPTDTTAIEALQDAISHADTEAELSALEAAFAEYER